MQIRYLTDSLAVSPQIAPSDVAALAQEGFQKIICNRPDSEVPPELQAAAIAHAAESRGLDFEVRPLTRETLTATAAAEQKQSIGDQKTLAYCASGTRCSVIWAIGEHGERADDDIIQTAAHAGYDLAPLWPLIAQAKSGGQ